MILDVAIIPWAWHQRHMQQKDFIKTLKRCTSADTIYRIKKQLTEWKKTLARVCCGLNCAPLPPRLHVEALILKVISFGDRAFRGWIKIK